MKKLIVSIVLVILVSTGFAKYVKFSVNMKGQILNVNGIHITGDFQSYAGFGLDWQPDTSPMAQEVADTNIYSLIVNIPAFKKYEFTFINGIFFYEAEFVPEKARVLYQFDSNRWIYVDSLSADTMNIGAIPFGGTAPFGQRLLRLRVDMSSQTVNAAGTHVAGSFQAWSTVNTYMYSFDTIMYEYIAYVDTNTINYQYKYLNGITAGDYETVPGGCADGSGNRMITVLSDTMLDVVCFASCSACVSTVGIVESNKNTKPTLAPNPTDEYSLLQFNDNVALHTINIYDVTGRNVRTYSDYAGNELRIDKGGLDGGIYFVNANTKENFTTKLVIE